MVFNLHNITQSTLSVIIVIYYDALLSRVSQETNAPLVWCTRKPNCMNSSVAIAEDDCVKLVSKNSGAQNAMHLFWMKKGNGYLTIEIVPKYWNIGCQLEFKQ